MSGVKEVRFRLSSPVKFSNNGAIEDAYELIMRAPSMRDHRYVAVLKAGFFKAIKESQVMAKAAEHVKPVDLKEKDKAATEMTPEQVMLLLYMSEIDVDKYIDNFSSLCANGVVTFPNDQKINIETIKSMSVEDCEKMCGEYLLNFIIGSLS